MDTNVIGNVLNGVNLVKNRVNFGENFQNWGCQNYIIGESLGKLVNKYFLQKFRKIILVGFVDINLGKIGNFGENSKNWVISGPKCGHKSKLG